MTVEDIVCMLNSDRILVDLFGATAEYLQESRKHTLEIGALLQQESGGIPSQKMGEWCESHKDHVVSAATQAKVDEWQRFVKSN